MIEKMYALTATLTDGETTAIAIGEIEVSTPLEKRIEAMEQLNGMQIVSSNVIPLEEPVVCYTDVADWANVFSLNVIELKL